MVVFNEYNNTGQYEWEQIVDNWGFWFCFQTNQYDKSLFNVFGLGITSVGPYGPVPQNWICS